MTTVILERNINEILDIVEELRSHGLTQGTDFDFEYHQMRHDPISGHLIHKCHTIFTFYGTGESALLFKLKYVE
jgi:hypothetical protein